LNSVKASVHIGQRPMSFARNILMRMFGRPEGIFGRLGGRIMARSNRDCAAWVVGQLGIRERDSVLEIGFGPGVAIALLAEGTPAGHIAGVDQSVEMVEQATARNAEAIDRGRVSLQRGSVEHLRFADATFDRALAINSMQTWPDAIGGLREVHRVLKPGGALALGFTRHSGQPKRGLAETLLSAGFTAVSVLEHDTDFCARAIKPPARPAPG
jgi:ubiquinone/menaquinone biosynthesis C-methylase UbiE